MHGPSLSPQTADKRPLSGLRDPRLGDRPRLLAETLWHLTFRNSFLDDYLYHAAFGSDPEWLPVYELLGDVDDPSWLLLKPVNMIYPGCLRMLPHAEELTPLTAMTRAEIEQLYPKATPLPEPTPFVQQCIDAANAGRTD